MKDTAPISLGIMAVAAVFGIIGAGVAFVMWDFSAIGALFIGAIVALVVIILLMLGWRAPAAQGPGAASPNKEPVGAAASPNADAPSATAPVAPAPAAAPVAATATAAVDDAPAAPAAAAEKPAEKPKKEAKPKAKAAPKAKASAPKPQPVAADGKPELLDGPRDGGADDLKQIKGVGPKMEGMLNGMGIYHFDQVASWRKKEVEWVDENLEGFNGRVTRDEWVKQAKVLAQGGTTEFSSKVKKGGVY